MTRVSVLLRRLSCYIYNLCWHLGCLTTLEKWNFSPHCLYCGWIAKGRQLAGCHGHGISNTLATCVTWVRQRVNHIASWCGYIYILYTRVVNCVRHNFRVFNWTVGVLFFPCDCHVWNWSCFLGKVIFCQGSDTCWRVMVIQWHVVTWQDVKYVSNQVESETMCPKIPFARNYGS